MNIDIRKSIRANFNQSDEKEILDAIEGAIADQEEVTLPGLGVFFETLWKSSSQEERENIVKIIQKNLG